MTSRSRKRPAVALLLAGVLSLTGCASTVSLEGPSARAGKAAPADGIGAPGAEVGEDASAAGRDVDGTVQPGESGQLPGSTGGTGPATGSVRASGGPELPDGTTGGTSSDGFHLGPGVTDGTVSLGIPYDTNSAQGNAGFGANVDSGDARTYYNAVIADVNKRGGVAGRKLKPVYFGLDANSSTDVETQKQSACQHWTRDHHVFAMLATGGEVLHACAERSGAVELTTLFSSSTTRTFRRYPHYVEVGAVRLDRLGDVTVGGVAQGGYFTDKGIKVGLVTWDQQAYVEAINNSYLPALAKQGIKDAQVSRIASPSTAGDLGASSAAVQSSVTKFQAAGVTHVMILDGPNGICDGTCLTLLWLNAAQSQQYQPRYGFNTNNSPGSGLFTPYQLHRSLTVTWADQLPQADEGYHPNAQRNRCAKLMADAGVDTSDSAALSESQQACDLIWFFEHTGNLVGRNLDNDAFMTAVNRLATTYDSPVTFVTRFNETRHDGAAAVRTGKYTEGCTGSGCFTFINKPYEPK